MFLNRDPELTGEIAGYQQAVKVQVKSFKGGIAHWRILLRQWDID
tara:strand:+ start:528 stop:662 length:135 start_codon:yes stop_codon:yes gene_type:complete